MTVKHILVVDDEEDILELVSYNLMREGYRVSCAESGETAITSVQSDPPDLIVLDLMLPGLSGLEVAKNLKNQKKSAHIPIIMLSAKGEEADIVTGLELGADDYVTKPFSPKILIARVRAVVRRKADENKEENSDVIVSGNLTIHTGRHQVLSEGIPVDLTYSEFQLLLLLCRRPGWVFTRNQIVDAIHGENYAVTDRSVDVLVVGLRKKLGACGFMIETVRGIGYRFKEL
ncbi:MAG: response regulator transcription factor [Desulfobacteraceae bacterium]|nr:response regulator transcription factor [Desulfobacteraceae bacterium]